MLSMENLHTYVQTHTLAHTCTWKRRIEFEMKTKEQQCLIISVADLLTAPVGGVNYWLPAIKQQQSICNFGKAHSRK